jgi:hypothetical protein
VEGSDSSFKRRSGIHQPIISDELAIWQANDARMLGITPLVRAWLNDDGKGKEKESDAMMRDGVVDDWRDPPHGEPRKLDPSGQPYEVPNLGSNKGKGGFKSISDLNKLECNRSKDEGVGLRFGRLGFGERFVTPVFTNPLGSLHTT